MLWVKGSGGDLRTRTRENFSSLYQEKLLSLQKVYARSQRARAENPRPRTTWWHVHRPLHVQPEPARVVDRHAAAFLHPLQARRSHASQRGHRRRRSANSVQLTKEIYGGEGRAHALAAAGLRARPGDAADLPRKSEGASGIMMGQHGLINWAERRQGMLLPHARSDRDEPRNSSRRNTRQRAATQRPSAAQLHRRCRTERAAQSLCATSALAARAGQPAEALHRHDAGRRDDPALRELERCAAPGRTRHVLPRPFPAHQDQAALRSARADRRQSSTTRGSRLRRAAQREADRRARRSIARTTRPTTTAASGPIRRPCAIRTRP